MSNNLDQLTDWLKEHKITEVECMISDLTGITRGKISPTNKFIAWSTDVREMINHGTTRAQEIEQNIGRFTHLGVVMPSVHHFMSCLRE